MVLSLKKVLNFLEGLYLVKPVEILYICNEMWWEIWFLLHFVGSHIENEHNELLLHHNKWQTYKRRNQLLGPGCLWNQQCGVCLQTPKEVQKTFMLESEGPSGKHFALWCYSKCIVCENLPSGKHFSLLCQSKCIVCEIIPSNKHISL